MTKQIPVTSYLFVLGQALCVAQSFVAAFHLQHERLVVAVRAAVCTAGHGEVVHCAETVETGVAADLMDSTAQDHLMLALQVEGGQQRTARVISEINPFFSLPFLLNKNLR